MANIFGSNDLDQQTAAAIDAQVSMAAKAQLNAYNAVRRLVYNNPRFKKSDGSFDSDAVYAAFSANTKLGMTADDLGKMAMVAKATINLFQPGTITDSVPAATISFGS